MNLDISELIKRAIKYLVEGLVVAIVAVLIPKKSLDVKEVIIIALTAACSFSLLDTVIPAMGASMRQGAGMGLGFNLVSFPL